MNEELDIIEAFVLAVRGLNLNLPIALENDDFKPPKKGQWLELFLLPTDKESLGKKHTDSDQYDGVYQVSIYDQLYTGVKESRQIAQKIVDRFNHGVELTAGGVTITISKTVVRRAFRTGGYYHTPVQITFSSYIERS